MALFRTRSGACRPKMAILQACCCWNNVRQGSTAAAVYTILLALLNGALAIYHLVLIQNMFLLSAPLEADEVLQSHPFNEDLQSQPFNETLYIEESFDDIQFSTTCWLLGSIVGCALWLLGSIILIIGVQKDKHQMFIPWLVITIVMVILDTTHLIYECIVFGVLVMSVLFIIIWLALTALNAYCVLCVVSQYQELKAGRGTADYIQRQRARIIYRAGIEQVHITQGPIVMMFPGTVSSSAQVQEGPNGATGVSTTVTIQPPDYKVATSQLPRYTAVPNAEGEAKDDDNVLADGASGGSDLAPPPGSPPPASPPPIYEP